MGADVVFVVGLFVVDASKRSRFVGINAGGAAAVRPISDGNGPG